MQKNIIIIVVIIIIAAGAYLSIGRATPSSDESVLTSETARIDYESPIAIKETPETGTDDEVAVSAAEMPYTVSVSYLTPSRTSHDMNVTLVIAEDGTITDASIEYDNGEGFSNGHQERFDNAYKNEVVGQKITDVELSTVAGASLTTDSFNEAITKIIEQRA